MRTTRDPLISTEQLRRLIEAGLPDLVAIRHDLHAHPELGYEERRTSGVVQRELRAAGIEFAADLAGGTGVLAHLSGGAKKAVGLRADMDALPIEEEGGVAYRSTHPGVMHACGHDGHTTILLGAARVLSKIARDHTLPRPVTFVFQPAEEGGAGGRRMVRDGCLNGTVIGPRVEIMFGLHGWPEWRQGVVGTREGPLLAATDDFDITLRGVGAHAAFPQGSRDPIVAASAVVSALQTIAARNVDPLDAIVISVTRIHGGTAYNIIPGEVTFSGTVRTLRPETRKLALERLNELATGVAVGFGCEARVDHKEGYPVTLNHPEAVSRFNQIARETLGKERVQAVENPVMGGEDFSFYCHEVPACFFVLGLIPPGSDAMPQLHQPTFDFNDGAIATGVEVFCRLALQA